MTTITAHLMSSTRTEHWAVPTVAGEEYGTWCVSWLPGRELSRNQAITAMTLAEFVAGGVTSPEHRKWTVMHGWAAELGLTAPDAVAHIVGENAATDLFGNPVEAAPRRPSTPDPPPVNDMDLVNAVLSSAGTVGFHLGSGDRKVYRCADTRVEPVPSYEEVAVHQLLDAGYLDVTKTRACPFATHRKVEGHGPAVRLTKRGTTAFNRWRAYKRPTTWNTTSHRA
jgi:hypothetical protein